jgi:hypothetical protein
MGEFGRQRVPWKAQLRVLKELEVHDGPPPRIIRRCALPKKPKKMKKDLQRRAIDEPRVTLDDLADATGRRRVTMEKYRELKLTMPDSVRLKLAAFLDRHAQRLRALAEELKGDPK